MKTSKTGRVPTNSRGHYLTTTRELHAVAQGPAWQGFDAEMPVTLRDWRGSVWDALRQHARTMGDFERVEAFRDVEISVTLETTPAGNVGTHKRLLRTFYVENVIAY